MSKIGNFLVFFKLMVLFFKQSDLWGKRYKTGREKIYTTYSQEEKLSRWLFK
jgi:hypothetical protein